ncbi:MAG: DUF151 domain-containing protein [Chlamydiae bacterium]|nr:DUF151 domain-containing protein [Chlamydiota bacterium]
MQLVPVTFKKIMQSKAYTVIILGTDKKQFAIYTEPSVGKTIQQYLTEEPRQRPFTQDLINAVFKGFDIKILQVVIHDMEDTIYFARLFLEKTLGEERHILEIDARPSDCIMLAVLNKVPVLCKKELLEKVIALEE